MDFSSFLKNISDLTNDSRQVKSGMGFIACKGATVDGRDFITQAIQAGAKVVFYEEKNAPPLPATDVPLIPVLNLNSKQGEIAAEFYRHPSCEMTTIGVTGTNGKTSITHYLAQALPDCAVLGTLGYGLLPNLMHTTHTTPDAVTLQSMLVKLKQLGAKACAMEVSSHSLDQCRVNGVEFNTAVFTNLSRDHLDYHGNMQAYAKAKAQLLHWEGLKNAVINADDAFGRQFLREGLQATCYLFSLDADSCADVKMTQLELLPVGFRVAVTTPWGDAEFKTQLLGRFNVSNCLAVLTVLGALHVPLVDIAAVLEKLTNVAGRMQVFGGGSRPTVVIDYAHTPDALQQALQALREHCSGRLWCVFGCGGDRDRGKRAEMGAIAAKYSDQMIITNDNPRTEDPQVIVADIQQGLSTLSSAQIELNRADAIGLALQQASDVDVVLVAGKGHEDYQIIGDQRLSFSDAEVVQRLLKV